VAIGQIKNKRKDHKSKKRSGGLIALEFLRWKRQ
jgi:hypothetical protein